MKNLKTLIVLLILSLVLVACGGSEAVTEPTAEPTTEAAPTEEAMAETRQQALSQVVNYSAQKTYWRGQKIRHKKFDDTGIVMSKEKTDGDHNIIIVKFENVGQKKLVEDCMAAA